MTSPASAASPSGRYKHSPQLSDASHPFEPSDEHFPLDTLQRQSLHLFTCILMCLHLDTHITYRDSPILEPCEYVQSAKTATYYHFGTAAHGSLIIAIIQTIRAAVTYAQRQVSWLFIFFCRWTEFVEGGYGYADVRVVAVVGCVRRRRPTRRCPTRCSGSSAWWADACR